MGGLTPVALIHNAKINACKYIVTRTCKNVLVRFEFIVFDRRLYNS